VKATDRRLKAVKIGGIYLLDDSYNASPDSMKAGISALCGVDAKRRIAVLGDMLELGGADESGHTEVGRFAAESGVDMIIAVGSRKDLYFKGVREAGTTGTSTIGLADLDSVKDMILQILKEGDAVLVKGSNSTGLGQVAELIRNSEETWKRS
jgi:UDP-N-acetylmuramoyl-tripeptide--D-alanyl-D-alanine ligase